MQHFDASEVNRLLTFPIVMDALEEAHRRPPIIIADALLGDENGNYFVRSAVDPDRFACTKMVTSTPRNLYSGDLPAVQAVVVIFDAHDGQPLASMDGTMLTRWRTAGDSGLGARLLARADARTLLVVGAGAMSRPLAHAHCAARPGIDRVMVWNRNAARAHEVVADLVTDGLPAVVVTDLQQAVRASDIVSTATRATEPVVFGADLKPGAHLDLVGGFTPATRETDDEAMARGLVFVDRREPAFDGVGDILSPIASGAITEADVLGDLHDLVARRVGRTSPDDITIFKNAGGGHLDLFTAEALLRSAGRI
jgi:ornithine cyclodeaminase